ncbi:MULTISPECIES: hypothetical protein [unclassified Roseivirga]|uniref:hypothetical protein n=1 Tax=unclassified Roseivirga TaxID=2626142 RepID=UPI00257BC96F|nr:MULTISPECIES: hypothetical protein [unclassified Roseivirga]MEC7753677.1 hypothetical protein [Bacteroidota bacterium]|tara:strand:+ start:30 stop:524 length:495 start_codon:yes stop_codon:yes gene_type:complete
MNLSDPEFDKQAYFKRLESLIYLLLMLPLLAFGWVFLEKNKAGDLRSVFFDNPDLMFHGVMGIGVGYIVMRTTATWNRDMRKATEPFKELDVKLKMLRKPILYRNVLWAFGAAIGAYGLYEKGDMVYAMVFTVFLVLMTANRPTGRYFAKLLKLKGEERQWMER